MIGPLKNRNDQFVPHSGPIQPRKGVGPIHQLQIFFCLVSSRPFPQRIRNFSLSRITTKMSSSSASVSLFLLSGDIYSTIYHLDSDLLFVGSLFVNVNFYYILSLRSSGFPVPKRKPPQGRSITQHLLRRDPSRCVVVAWRFFGGIHWFEFGLGLVVVICLFCVDWDKE